MLVRTDPLSRMQQSFSDRHIDFLVICPKCKDTQYIGNTIQICNPPIYTCTKCNVDFSRGGICGKSS